MAYGMNPSLFKKTYNDGVNQGFTVTDVQQSSSMGVPIVTTEMKTPYTYNGEPLMGFAVTELSQTEDDKLRKSQGMELWTVNGLGQRDRNLEDVVGGGDFSVQDKDGNTVSYADARDSIGTFSAAASEYPHVFMYDEYVAVRTPINERLRVGPPNEVDYEKYLDSVFRQMGSKDFTFVGAITDRNGLTQARNSMPSVQDMMSDRARSDDGLDF